MTPAHQKPTGPNQVLTCLTMGVALLMIAYHVLNVWFPLFAGIIHQNFHLGFCFVLLPLTWAIKEQVLWKRILQLLLIPVTLFLVGYVGINYERLDMFAGFPDPPDVVVGVIMIVLVIYYTWRGFGPIFPVLIITAIAYAFFGEHIPGILSHPAFEPAFIVSNLSIGLQGIYGMLLGASANILFLLLVFGATFEATGVTSFFTELGIFLGRRFRGGSAHTAIFSSSFVGMVNGAASANVAITGSYTIPTMKKTGYRGETAGAIEAMASAGGSLTPPIMGIAVFIMAAFLGVSYGDLMFKALIPAIIYYLLAIFTVIVIARREKIPKLEKTVNKKVIVSGAPVFLVPIMILTYLLVNHYTVGYAAFWGIVSILLISSLRKETRPRIGELIKGLVSGAVIASTFGVAVACIGMFIKIMTFTALNTKLSILISTISEKIAYGLASVPGTDLLPVLFMTMVLSILLSSSTPTVVAYIIVAFVAAPILTEMGIQPAVAHFFVYYYAILACVTPPVAGAAMVGSKIAETPYLKTAFESFRMVGPFFILPYFLVNNPVLFLEHQAFLPALMGLVSLVIAMGSLMCFFQRYCLRDLGFKERSFFLINALVALWYGITGLMPFFIGCFGLTLILLTLQLVRYKQSAAALIV